MARVKDKIREKACCCHILTGRIIGLIIASVLIFSGLESKNYGWFVIGDFVGNPQFDVAAPGQAAGTTTSPWFSIGYKTYCYGEVEVTNGQVNLVEDNFAEQAECVPLDESIDTEQYGTVEYGSASLKSWGQAVVAALALMCMLVLSYLLFYVCLSLNMKPLGAGFPYFRAYAWGSVITGTLMLIAYSGFTEEAVENFQGAFNNSPSSSTPEMYPLWFTGITFFLGLGFLGSGVRGLCGRAARMDKALGAPDGAGLPGPNGVAGGLPPYSAAQGYPTQGYPTQPQVQTGTYPTQPQPQPGTYPQAQPATRYTGQSQPPAYTTQAPVVVNAAIPSTAPLSQAYPVEVSSSRLMWELTQPIPIVI
ncbi:unnamed protein product [Chrysoparadoxa australica]